MEANKITPAVIIWQNTLKEVPLIDFSSNGRDVEGSLENWHQKIKDVIGYTWANSKRFFQTQMLGHYFSFSISHCPQINPRKNFHWQVYIWDMTGCNSIYSTTFPSDVVETDKMPEHIWMEIINHCEDFIIGKQDCSHCKTQMSRSQIAGTFYAGVYCEKCWNDKYKKISALENYD